MSIGKTRLIGIVAVALVLSIAFTSVSTAWPPNGPPYDECHSVVIGISTYENGPSGDKNANYLDATKFYLELLGSWSALSPITLLRNGEATEDAIDDALDSLANAGPNDLVVVYICAEHFDGAPDEENFATYDLVAYSATRLAQKLSQIDATAKVVVLDFCNSGNFEDALDVDGQVAIMACASNELAWGHRYGAFAHGIFSYYVNQRPDVNGDGVVTIEEVFGYADPLTTTDAASYGHSQHPIIVDNVPGDVAYLDS